MKRTATFSLYILAIISLVVCAVGCGGDKTDRLRVATTTSLYDTGLWDYLEPIFEEEYDVDLDVIYAGTGIAIEHGMNGDVDVIAVHSKSRELAFVEGGYGVERVPLAYNYFIIVGPADDPAGLQGLTPEDAFQKLYENPGSGKFVSRGDESGTHGKEKAIWASAGYDYAEVQEAGSWYIEAGRGMGPTLLMASEEEAYTLSDIATFLTYKGETELETIIEEGDILLNVYSVLASTKSENPEMANNMVTFLTSSRIQGLIGGYGTDKYGATLFTPCAGNEPQT